MTKVETQVAGYFAKYTPAMAKLGKALRAKLRKRLPGLNEIVYVYENQKSLVIAYSPTDQGGGSDAPIGMALYPNCAKLFFTKGAALSKLDPNKLLQGTGKTVRHIVVTAAAELDRAEIEALIAAVLRLGKVQLDPKAKGLVIIKADEQKQRAERSAKKVAAVRAAGRKAKARR